MDSNDAYIPLSVPNLKGNELKYVGECIKSEWISSAGSFVTRFENELASYVKAKYSTAVCNGTAALHLALLITGIKPGDEVFVPTLTFIAPVNTIKYVGATPIFIDCDDHLNISPFALSKFIDENCIYKKSCLINRKTGGKISAIIPVHIFGNAVDMEPIMDLAEMYGLKIIEDATESLGTYYTKGRYAARKTGTIGHIGCYSFNGNKIITTGGGGMLVSDNQEYVEKARYLSTQAKDDALHYVHHNIGYNYRMTNIQAALGCAQLEKIDEYIKIKRNNFAIYKKELAGISGLSFINEPEYCFSNFWFYSLMIEKEKFGIDKDNLISCLKNERIESRPIWHLNHMQKPYKNDPRGIILKAKKFFERVINIPCSANLRREDISRVIKSIKEVHTNG